MKKVIAMLICFCFFCERASAQKSGTVRLENGVVLVGKIIAIPGDSLLIVETIKGLRYDVNIKEIFAVEYDGAPQKNQEKGTIVLKSGVVLTGKTTSIPGDSLLTLETPNGISYRLPLSNVASINIKKTPEKSDEYRKARSQGIQRGRVFTLEESITIGRDLGSSICFFAGYRFSPYFSLQAGSGFMFISELSIDSYYTGCFMPFMARFKANFINRRVTPFFMCDLGYIVPLTEDYGTGIFSPTFGVSVKFVKRYGLDISMGPQLFMTDYFYGGLIRNEYSGYSTSLANPTRLWAFNIKLGFSF